MGKFSVPAALFALSFAIRLALIGKGPYHYDVAELILAAQRFISGEGLQYMHGAGYPLHVILASLFIRTFGSPVFAVNFMAVLASSLAVCLLYSCLALMFDRRAALFSSLLFTVYPAFLSVSVYGINNGISVLFALVSLYFLLRTAATGRRTALIASGIFMGCCVAVRLPDALFILPLTVSYIVSRDIRPVPQTAWFFIPWLAIPLACYAPMLGGGGVGQLFSAMTSVSQGKFEGLTSNVLGLSYAWFREMLTRPLVLLSGIGALLLFLRRRGVFMVLFIWFAVFFFYYGNVSTVEPRMLIMAGIPALAASGYALSRIYAVNRAAALAFLAVSGFLMFKPLLPVLQYRHQHAQAQEFFSWVDRSIEPHAAVMAGDNGIFLTFYTGRQPLAHPYTCDATQMRRFFDTEVESRLKAGIPVYMIRSAFTYDPCMDFRKMLEQRYSLVPVGSRTNEDWHHHCLTLGLFDDVLYKLAYKRGDIYGNSGSGRGAGGIDRGLGAAGAGQGRSAADHGGRRD
jgi:hypothetical protein